MKTFWFLWWFLVWPPPTVTPLDRPTPESSKMQGQRVTEPHDANRPEKAEVWARSLREKL